MRKMGSILIFFFLPKSLFKNSSAFKVIYFVCNIDENEILIFHIYWMLQKTFWVKKTKTNIPYLMDNTFSFYFCYHKLLVHQLMYLHGLFWTYYIPNTKKNHNLCKTNHPIYKIVNRTLKSCIYLWMK